MNIGHFWYAVLLVLITACNNTSAPTTPANDTPTKKTRNYGADVAFLQQYKHQLVELKDNAGTAKVLVSPGYQGRVMTSTSNGDSGISYGWINYDLIASAIKKKQFNPVGGENRFWIGPEGGQYSIYFHAGDSFNLNHWQVPAVIDTESYDIASSNMREVVFIKKTLLRNYSGTEFPINIERKIMLIDKQTIAGQLQIDIPSTLTSVAYESSNTITNLGPDDWKKEKGLLSIWLLGMFTPTPQTVVIIPFHPQADAKKFITDDYFGKIPAERLEVKDSSLFFTCDGKFRSKIGLSPIIAKSLAASFDFKNNVLTLIIFPVDKKGMYVNSKWEMQQSPYQGDVINSYNDGPLADGSQLGPFYEVESSSSTKELKKGEQLTYKETTCHFQGDYPSLQQFVKKLLGVDLNELKR